MKTPNFPSKVKQRRLKALQKLIKKTTKSKREEFGIKILKVKTITFTTSEQAILNL